jgi:hypothetical protein
LLVPSEEPGQTAAPEALERWQSLAVGLAADGRPFDELSPEERRSRLRQVMGAGRGISSSSEEFARQKANESELEERKFAH